MEWIVGACPDGLYLAPVEVSSVVGTITADLRPTPRCRPVPPGAGWAQVYRGATDVCRRR